MSAAPGKAPWPYTGSRPKGMELKTCTKCREIVAASLFRTRKNGQISPSCRKCDAEYSREYRKRNPARIAEYNKIYRTRHPDYQKNLPLESKDRRALLESIRRRTDEVRAKRRERRTTENHYTAKRRKRLAQATIFRNEIGAIKDFYSNCPAGKIVDHVVPIFGDNVCGLNVLSNLQYLTAVENSRKGKAFDGTKSNNSWRRRQEFWRTAKVGASGESALAIYRLPS